MGDFPNILHVTGALFVSILLIVLSLSINESENVLVSNTLQMRYPASINFNRIVLNGKVNLLKTSSEDLRPEARILKANVDHTLGFFSNAAVEFFNDSECEEMIRNSGVVKEQELAEFLAERFRNERVGAYKSDICRLIGIYEKGGMYFDNDIEVNVNPVTVIKEYNRMQKLRSLPPISFATNLNANKKGFFQAFIAVGPRNPVILRSIYYWIEFYQHKRKPNNHVGKRGPVLLKMAWEDHEGLHDKEHDLTGYFFSKQSSLIFPELHVANYTGAQEVKRHGDPENRLCDYIVVDVVTDVIIFYPRVEGVSKCKKR